MSYDIYFIKRKDINPKNIEELLTSDVSKSDIHYINREQMLDIKDALLSQGFKFDLFEDTKRDYIEINFPTYQIGVFNSQVVISLPYWSENSNDSINLEVKQITNILLEKGFAGYDPQTDEFIIEEYEFKEGFTEATNSIIENQKFTETLSETKNDENLASSNKNSNLLYLGIVLVIIVLSIALWRFMKK